MPYDVYSHKASQDDALKQNDKSFRTYAQSWSFLCHFVQERHPEMKVSDDKILYGNGKLAGYYGVKSISVDDTEYFIKYFAN